jgi:hypothetical protein
MQSKDYTHYTLAEWRVKPGMEQQFIDAWTDMGKIFSALEKPPVDKGTLIQSLSDPGLFYSFGPWQKLDDIKEMRNNPECRQAMTRLKELCTEISPNEYKLVKEIKL